MATNRKEWIIIGISGVTCSGKTTLSNNLGKLLTPVYIFHQDKYFYPDESPKHVKCEDLDHNNYDILSSLDMDLMHRDVLDTIRGENKAHQTSVERKPGRVVISGKKFLIVEGFTVLNFKPLLEICDFRYYFVLEYGECFARRCLRVYDPPDIPGYFDRCVWPQHLRYRAEIERDPRIHIIDGTKYDALETVLSQLKAVGAKEITS